MRGLGIKIKWPSTGADGGVLRAWWLAVDVVGRPAGQSEACGGGYAKDALDTGAGEPAAPLPGDRDRGASHR